MDQADFNFALSGFKCRVIVGASFEELAPAVSSLIKGHKALILTDSVVAGQYLNKVVHLIENDVGHICTYEIPSGEESKGFRELNAVIDCLISHSFTRQDLIINLGGGVVSDLGGFAASVYMRGIDYISIPTTLLSMVDSSFGGKTGINFSGIKNAVGAFHHPRLVADPVEFLNSLDEREVRSGYGEIVKYHLLTEMDIMPLNSRENSEKLISNCIKAKYAFTSDDVFDSGKRKFLNLGHTFGHAFEAASGFKLSHGEAVALGLYAEALFAADIGILPVQTAVSIRDTVEKFDLPTDFSKYACCAAGFIAHDKKCSGGTIDLPLVEKPGKPFFAKVELNKAMLFLENFN